MDPRRHLGFDLFVTFRGKPLRIMRGLFTLDDAVAAARRIAVQRGMQWGPVEIYDAAADVMLTLEAAARDARPPSLSGTMERVVVRGDATQDDEVAPTKRSAK